MAHDDDDYDDDDEPLDDDDLDPLDDDEFDDEDDSASAPDDRRSRDTRDARDTRGRAAGAGGPAGGSTGGPGRAPRAPNERDDGPNAPRSAQDDVGATNQPGRDSDDAHDAATVRRRPPAAGKGLVSAPPHVRQLRVATVARALVDGFGRAAILQAVAKAQTKEAAERARARRAFGDKPVDVAELNGLVPLVWGDVPVPERTIDAYIQRAKLLLADEGKKLSRQREYVLAIQLARLNEVYLMAFQAKRPQACVQVIREVNRMFGMYEAIKTLLLSEARAQSEAEQPAVESLSTEEAKASAMSSLVLRAAERDPTLHGVFARFAQLSTNAAPQTSPQSSKSTPSTNGKYGHNGTNGTNGKPSSPGGK